MLHPYKTAGFFSLLALLSACASGGGVDDTLLVETAEPVVVPPVVTEVIPEPEGPVPGTQEDLEENVGNRIFFSYDEYTLTPEAREILSRQAAWFNEYPETRILIAGSADERGTREYNLALGARRAEAARSFLTGLGVDGVRITTISYGKERPVDSRSNEQAWSLNRNATMVVESGMDLY